MNHTIMDNLGISIKGLRQSFHTRDRDFALNIDELEIPSTGFYAFLGESGSGKSTLLNILGLLLKPEEGEVSYFGKKVTFRDERECEKLRRDYLAFVFQDYNLVEELSVKDNLALIENNPENIVSALERCSISHLMNLPVASLSGGERQRVSIARALLKKSKILLTDEPTGNLDKDNASSVFSLLKEISKSQIVIIVTHDEERAKSFCDAIFRLDEGKIIERTWIEKKEEADATQESVNDRLMSLPFYFKYSKCVFGKRKGRFISSAILMVLTFFTMVFTVNFFLYDMHGPLKSSLDNNPSDYLKLSKYHDNSMQRWKISGGKDLYDGMKSVFGNVYASSNDIVVTNAETEELRHSVPIQVFYGDSVTTPITTDFVLALADEEGQLTRIVPSAFGRGDYALDLNGFQIKETGYEPSLLEAYKNNEETSISYELIRARYAYVVLPFSHYFSLFDVINLNCAYPFNIDSANYFVSITPYSVDETLTGREISVKESTLEFNNRQVGDTLYYLDIRESTTVNPEPSRYFDRINMHDFAPDGVVVKSTFDSSETATIKVSPEFYEFIAGELRYSQASLYIENDANTKRISNDILANDYYLDFAYANQIFSLDNGIRGYGQYILAVAILFFAIVFLTLINFALTSIDFNVRNIAIFRAMGIGRTRIAGLFSFQFLALEMMAFFVGSVLGVLTTIAVNLILTSLNPIINYWLLSITFWPFLICFAVSLLSSSIIFLLCLLKVFRKNIIDVLRNN